MNARASSRKLSPVIRTLFSCSFSVLNILSRSEFCVPSPCLDLLFGGISHRAPRSGSKSRDPDGLPVVSGSARLASVLKETIIDEMVLQADR